MTGNPEPRPFRFGVGAAWPKSPEDWLRHARQAEDHGYDVLTVSDHLSDQLSPMLALATAASVTSSISLGTLVLCNDLRNPVVMASEALTISAMSAGRMELGLGTGWKLSDYQSGAMVFSDAATRAERLAKSLSVVKRRLTDNDFFHTASGVGRSRPKILVGGGSRVLLSLAAQHADIISLGPVTRRGRMLDRTMTQQATAEKVGWIRDAAVTRFPGIELNAVIFDVAVEPRWQFAAHSIAAKRTELGVAGVMASPHFLVGSVSQIVDKLAGLREAFGISYFKVPGRHLVDFAPVVAALRGA
ncbi:hypothetical protein IQ62_18115 [Streptomyces scabiei]|uniref:TIGR03621 family F420-dependent LLM class oxidoreductase n=1 Tax=Streptomyces scabiei TaxID=1930 RepID=UPI0004E689E9|nr:TIGR03621 family F420-dependent LLM class oxidoreductase [Streptomyces scabiei]KFF99571.1 hypothetical protein IQ62_18115 [Streptomyces scabiei]